MQNKEKINKTKFEKLSVSEQRRFALGSSDAEFIYQLGQGVSIEKIKNKFGNTLEDRIKVLLGIEEPKEISNRYIDVGNLLEPFIF